MAKKGKKGRRGGKRHSTQNVTEHASMSVSEALLNNADVGKVYRSDTVYAKMDTNLGQFPRAVQVAQAYQFYRIKKIRLTFKPAFDTFAENPAGSTTMKPDFYYMLDKSGAIPSTVNAEGLRQMGARPLPLDEKPIHVNWSPSVLTAAGDGGGGVFVGTDYKISPWLSTNLDISNPVFNPSSVQHLGCYWIAEQRFVTDKQLFYTVDLEVQFEFKKPIWKSVTTESIQVTNV